jgi:hypothetical protein
MRAVFYEVFTFFVIFSQNPLRFGGGVVPAVGVFACFVFKP